MPDHIAWNEPLAGEKVIYQVEIDGQLFLVENVSARVNVETVERLQQAVYGGFQCFAHETEKIGYIQTDALCSDRRRAVCRHQSTKCSSADCSRASVSSKHRQ